MNVFTLTALRMSIADNLRRIRRERQLTLQQMADLVGLHLNQVRRYEIGETQPSLDALKKIALALSITTDDLIFGEAERGPDEALNLKFEALRQFSPQERVIAEGVLDSLIVQHQAKRLFQPPLQPKAQAAKPQHLKKQGPQRPLWALCVRGDQEVNLEPSTFPETRWRQSLLYLGSRPPAA